ncbi:MAG: manganese efflux pump MntP family protein [Clostridium sp.]
MLILEIVLIGIALAMDAFGVTISVGVNSSVDRKSKIKYLVSFAFFQGAFTFIGAGIGYYIDNYIVDIPHIIGSVILSIVGILMIIEGFKEKENTVLTKSSMCIIMGISVSIDAMVVGFTVFHNVSNMLLLFMYSLIVGLITLLLCYIGFIICKYLKKFSFVEKYADFFGGVVLIIFAIKMLLF